MRFIPTLIVMLACFVSAQAAQKKPNVLFIAVDDMNTHLGCYGNPIARTPHIDALAKRGVLFQRAYTQYPLCNPQRSSLMSGLYPTHSGVTDNTTWFRTAMPDVTALPQHFRENGYTTVKIGKHYHGGLDDPKAWSIGGEPAPGSRPKRTPVQDAARKANADRFEALPNDELTADHRTAQTAIEALRAHKDKPFFIAVGFVKPHVPLVASRQYFDLYDPAKIPLPADYAPNLKLAADVPAVALTPSSDLFIGRDSTPEEARKMIAAYYACISQTDELTGRVIAELDTLDLDDNTVIVFWGDHGFHLGQKGKWSKHNSLFEPVAHVPLMMAGPGIKSGKPSPRTVQLLDIYPTLVELCGLPRVDHLQGHSLVPLLKDPVAPWGHHAVTVNKRSDFWGRSIRDERYRYTEWAGGEAGAELYDYDTDPAETRNLAADPGHAAVVARLKKALAESPVSRAN